MQWIIDNKEWILSGIGISVPLAIITYFISKKSRKSNDLVQKGRNANSNYQSNGPMTINTNTQGSESNEAKSKR